MITGFTADFIALLEASARMTRLSGATMFRVDLLGGERVNVLRR